MANRRREKELKASADQAKARVMQGFFKTGKGEYSEGDVFLGLTVPAQREIARRYGSTPLRELERLLQSKIHEFRFTALQILVFQYEHGADGIADFYIKHKARVNNWDLVDTSAPYILGDWLKDKDRSILYELIESKSIWDRRIAIVTTYAFIKAGDFKDILKLSALSLKDEHDLIHKACGWMLREVGKKSERALTGFLDKNAKKMPRTMLRYSLERLSEAKRKHYMLK